MSLKASRCFCVAWSHASFLGFGNPAFVDRRVVRDATVSLNGGVLRGRQLPELGWNREETGPVVGPERVWVSTQDTLVPWASPALQSLSAPLHFLACPGEAAPGKNPEAEAKVALACSVSAHLNIDDGDGGLGLVKVASNPVHGFWDEVQHQIQIHFIFLERGEKKETRHLDV